MNPSIAAKLKYWILILLGLAVATYMYQNSTTPILLPPVKEIWSIYYSGKYPRQRFCGQVTNANISENEISGVWHCRIGLVPFSLRSRDGKTYKGLVNGTDNLTLFKINDYRYEGHWYDNENGSGTIVLRRKN